MLFSVAAILRSFNLMGIRLSGGAQFADSGWRRRRSGTFGAVGEGGLFRAFSFGFFRHNPEFSPAIP